MLKMYEVKLILFFVVSVSLWNYIRWRRENRPRKVSPRISLTPDDMRLLYNKDANKYLLLSMKKVRDLGDKHTKEDWRSSLFELALKYADAGLAQADCGYWKEAQASFYRSARIAEIAYLIEGSLPPEKRDAWMAHPYRLLVFWESAVLSHHPDVVKDLAQAAILVLNNSYDLTLFFEWFAMNQRFAHQQALSPKRSVQIWDYKAYYKVTEGLLNSDTAKLKEGYDFARWNYRANYKINHPHTLASIPSTALTVFLRRIGHPQDEQKVEIYQELLRPHLETYDSLEDIKAEIFKNSKYKSQLSPILSKSEVVENNIFGRLSDKEPVFPASPFILTLAKIILREDFETYRMADLTRYCEYDDYFINQPAIELEWAILFFFALERRWIIDFDWRCENDPGQFSGFIELFLRDRNIKGFPWQRFYDAIEQIDYVEIKEKNNNLINIQMGIMAQLLSEVGMILLHLDNGGDSWSLIIVSPSEYNAIQDTMTAMEHLPLKINNLSATMPRNP